MEQHPLPLEERPGGQKESTFDPQRHFAHWVYQVVKAHWPIFGVSLREYINTEPTEAARKRAQEQGMSRKMAVKHIRVTTQRYAIAANPPYDFSEGDLFKPSKSGLPVLQVLDIADALEVHAVSNDGRHAYRITAPTLANWLETGAAPPDRARIDRWQSARQSLISSIAEWPPTKA